MSRKIILLFLLFCSLPSLADEPRKGLDKLWGVRVAKKLMAFIDTMATSSIDQRYIEVPEKPWQVIVNGNINQSDLKFKSNIDASSMFWDNVGKLHWEQKFRTEPSTYIGFWAGYRGYGLGYSKNVGGDKGSFLTFGAMGGAYGINLRIHNFENSNPEILISGKTLMNPGDKPENAVFVSQHNVLQMLDPVKTRTLLLDGYYLFNGKHFSYAAAYDQSVIQRRSAGSLMAGAMYYYSHINYANDKNALFILLMDDIGRIKQWQASVGVGYAYNLVPCRGLLVNVQAMPMITFYNRSKTWRYDSNYRDWAVDTEYHDVEDMLPDEWRLKEEPLSVNDSHSNLRLNINARMSITYNWKRFFANAYGQFVRFSYKDGDVHGRLNDWYVNTSLGVRF